MTKSVWAVGQGMGYGVDLHQNRLVPFVEPNISAENLSAVERDEPAHPQTYAFRGLRPGLTFGWDLRPDRLQSLILRTNLRWSPNLNVTMGNGTKNTFEQLEFNFIQAVVYPQRMFRKK